MPFLCNAGYSGTTEQNTYLRHVQNGMSSMKSGDYQSARDSFEEALRYDDAGVEAHLGLGMVYYHQGDDRYAERELKRVLELDPRIVPAYEVLGEISYRKDDLETAISYWEKTVELDPSPQYIEIGLPASERNRRRKRISTMMSRSFSHEVRRQGEDRDRQDHSQNPRGRIWRGRPRPVLLSRPRDTGRTVFR